MEFYFGKVDASKAVQLENSTLFKKQDTYFKFKMIFNEEGIVLFDSKGRLLAFETESLKDLETAIYVAREYELANKDAEIAKQTRINNLKWTLKQMQIGTDDKS